ncbi:MAG: Zn-ribbon domain-containing OB-fold protein [Acidimicrobiales bacterium]
MAGPEVLSAPNILEYPYSRTTGPVIGRFMTGLRQRRILGVRMSDGGVMVPPTEYDPVTADSLDEMVEVGEAGVVTTWTWVNEPRQRHPFDHPFAWALIRLDGADTGMLHAVDAGSEAAMSSGMRVTARWRAERVGEISDIECFVPDPPERVGATEVVEQTGEGQAGDRIGGADRAEGAAAGGGGGDEGAQVRSIRAPVRIEYEYIAGRAMTRFLRGMESGHIMGQRCPDCGKVYVPPRGACASCGVPTEEEVEVSSSGTVTTFCVVNVPFRGQRIEIPYVSATIRLDGADIGFMHLVQGVEASRVHMGMRVEAVWAPEADLGPSMESILYFRPSGEPDADYEHYREYV